MNIDIYAATDELKRKIGSRIKEERKLKNWSQAKLGEEITNMLGAHEDGRAKSQGNISDWESGKRVPDLKCLICLSRLFTCSLGYLLCEYDARTYGENKIAKTIGLSPKSVNLLSNMAAWGAFSDYSKVLDKLISDSCYKNKEHRSLLDLIYLYLSFESKKNTKQKPVIWKTGVITYEANDGYIDPSAIALSDSLIEDAILIEISNALRDLKHSK